MKEMEGTSRDILKDNIEALGQLFPEAMEEGKIDFDKLKQLLGEYVDDDEERYSFKWNGKGRALRLSQTPSTGTLRPCKEESKDWDTTQNLYIEGDNLEVLKLLQKSYYGKVKMIYIDPPYNTGHDFVYKDDFKDNIENYKKITGQVDEEGNRIATNTESDGRFHTNWLNMMYPRLRLARNLLSNDGVIFISIDDNEQENLRRICDEIFGESNFIATIVWQKKTGASDAIHIATVTENILVFAKNINVVHMMQNFDAYDEKRYKYKDQYYDERGPYYYDNLDRGTLGYHESLDFGILAKDGRKVFPNGRICKKNDGWRWKWSKEKTEWGIKNGFIELQPSNTKECGWGVYYKIYLNVDNDGQKIIRSSPYKNIISNILNTHAANEAKQLFSAANIFSNPKPTELIKFFTLLNSNDNDIILDFFSGFATTAHAVMKLNSEDGGHRKFIMVQLPELTDEDSAANKAGYKNICEIGKERIRRAGEKIKAEAGENAADLDIGFKVFKLDTSNIKKWQPKEDVLTLLEESVSNFVPGRSEMDVVYEIMLKMGLDLTYPVDERKVGEQTVYVIGAGALMICLAEGITQKTAEGIIKLKEEYEPEAWQVVVRDSGFASDEDKTNAQETLKAAGLDEGSFISI